MQIIDYKYPKIIHDSTLSYASSVFQYDHYRIITRMARNSDLNAMKKLISIIDEKTFIKQVFIPNSWNVNAVEYTISRNKMELLKYMLSFDEIKNKYLNDNDQFYRLMFWLFSSGTQQMIDFVVNELQISQLRIIKLMRYKYPKPKQDVELAANGIKYHSCCLVSNIIKKDSLTGLKNLISIIEEKIFFEQCFISDVYNINPIEYGIQDSKVKTMEYVMSFEKIKLKCLNDKQILFRIVWWISNTYQSMCQYMITVLNLKKKQLKELQSFKYLKPKNIQKQYHKDARSYWDKTISNDDIERMLQMHQSVDEMK
eukprot:282624_1